MQHTSFPLRAPIALRAICAFALLLAWALMTRPAHAGGIEYPDTGVEAVGRGAAFTAKADDGTALIYNVAGFARQRGWRLTLGSNTAFHEATFQRAGVYPDNPNDKLTPWGGQAFPLVKSTGSPIPIPHLVLSTDLGTDRLTVGMGIYAPSALGGRIFPLGVDGKPSPARYDSVSGGGLIAYPSLFAAYRVTEWLDVGLAANFVIASIESTSVSSADLAKALCPNQEYQPCDTRQTAKATGGTVAFSIGAMVRPFKSLQIGAQFRTPHKLDAEGTVTAQSPAVQPAPITPGKAFITQPFPWILRGGIRYIGMEEKREAWDIEADFTYEAWGSALHDGTQVYIPKLSLYEDIHTTLKLGFQDTVSARIGGAYNIPIGASPAPSTLAHARDPRDILTVRGGVFYDSPSTKPENTRLAFDTLAKTGITLGAGLKHGPAQVNIAFAKIFHETREVTNGDLRPINGSQGGKPVDSVGAPYAPVNNGTYTASTFVIAAGVTIELDELFGPRRIPKFGADYEVTRDPDAREAPEDDEAKRTRLRREEATAQRTAPPPSEPAASKPDAAAEAPRDPREPRWWDESAATETATTIEPAPTPPKKATKRKKPRPAPKASTSPRTSAQLAR